MTRTPPPDAALTEALAPWREAWRIRRAHPRWVVLWTASAGKYQAFRLSRKHRRAVLTAATPEDLAAQIEQAEAAEQSRTPAGGRTNSPCRPGAG